MTQKDKVKELVGRGLNSYHTKSLQQMDRIEKKNKEQNHKISILSNELDNDYLTKTEEGSVVSLEHSKEGMVYLDELQGNTLVNYCTDGSKELTLNGDIDLEGTFVTTTEGVDNGKVDVMCEGNTLVNLSDINTVTLTGGHERITNLSKIKPNTKYTQIIRVLENSLKEGNERSVVAVINETDRNTKYSLFPQIDIMKNFVGIKKQVFTTPSTIDSIYTFGTQVRAYTVNTSGNIKIQELLIEGEFDETLPYFEGMKSVGELEENKIEILSSKNIAPSSSWKYTNHGIEFNFGSKTINESVYVHNISNKDIMVHTSINQNYSRGFRVEKNSKKLIELNEGEVIYCTSVNRTDGWSDSDVEKARNSFIITKKENELNKKEILLNEPLRALPNGVKDRIVKIGGKSYIERNCGEITLTELLEGITHNVGVGNQTSTMVFAIDRIINNLNYKQLVKNGVCDRFSNNTVVDVDKELIYFGQNINIRIDKTKLTSQDTEGFKQWSRNNPTKIVYQLETPIYEPLEIEPILSCYSEVTHFSNNSIIPCNMKIQNSGYNAIIKPSTLYTIALDTNKSGTIGMNLGGVKGTTTNNVLTLTTPATLTDDSLRLYGKGIKGSKVRILEGDKTNWIPSHFEGMKSSFEDKFDTTDNTYKMEILSNNKNYFNYKGELNQYYKGMSIGTEVNINTLQSDGGIFSNLFTANHHGRGQIIKVKPYTNYIIKSTVVNSGRININTPSMVNFEYGTALNGKLNKTFNTLNNNEICLSFHTSGNSSHPNAIFYDVELILESNDNLDYIPNKSNKIQFSSIEPLRGVDNIKDKFIFKDDKLMIERNCGYRRLDGTENWTKFNTNTKTVTQFYTDNSKQKHGTMVGTCTTVPWIGGRNANQEKEGLAGGGGAGVYLWLDVFNYKLESLDSNGIKNWLRKNNIDVVFELAEPIYEEIPFELQKIILEGYENGTLFFDTNIPPTSTITYAGETPIVKSVRLNKTEVLNNTNDINDNIIPYLMDMDYRVVCLQLQSEEFNGGVSMARLFGGTYEMLQRDIQSKRYSVDEYRHRLDAYLNANKITEEEYNKLGDMLNE